MTPEILSWLLGLRPKYLLNPGRILEVGSCDVNGSPRPLFEELATEYIGTDMQPGARVDRVVNNRALLNTFGVESFDTIICCECLEHDSMFLWTVQQITAMVKRGGHVIITTPTFGFPLHRYPKDYWRFGEDAYREIFFNETEYEQLEINPLTHAPIGNSVTMAGIGRRL